jgi:hypothetical protein
LRADYAGRYGAAERALLARLERDCGAETSVQELLVWLALDRGDDAAARRQLRRANAAPRNGTLYGAPYDEYLERLAEGRFPAGEARLCAWYWEMTCAPPQEGYDPWQSLHLRNCLNLECYNYGQRCAQRGDWAALHELARFGCHQAVRSGAGYFDREDGLLKTRAALTRLDELAAAQQLPMAQRSAIKQLLAAVDRARGNLRMAARPSERAYKHARWPKRLRLSLISLATLGAGEYTCLGPADGQAALYEQTTLHQELLELQRQVDAWQP